MKFKQRVFARTTLAILLLVASLGTATAGTTGEDAKQVQIQTHALADASDRVASGAYLASIAALNISLDIRSILAYPYEPSVAPARLALAAVTTSLVKTAVDLADTESQVTNFRITIEELKIKVSADVAAAKSDVEKFAAELETDYVRASTDSLNYATDALKAAHQYLDEANVRLQGMSQDLDKAGIAAVLLANKNAADKAAAEKAAEDAFAAKIAADNKAADDKAAALEKTRNKTAIKPGSSKAKFVTITCIKGKAMKKVTGLKPVFPKGYKKK